MSTIGKIMKKEIVVMNQDKSIAYALDYMHEQNINGAPVVDDHKRLVGMVVRADIYRFLISPGHYDNYPLHLVMSKEVITATEDEDLLEVVARLRKHDIVAIPIVKENSVVGLVSIEDMLDYFLAK